MTRLPCARCAVEATWTSVGVPQGTSTGNELQREAAAAAVRIQAVPLGAVPVGGELDSLLSPESKHEHRAGSHQDIPGDGRLDLVHPDVVIGRVFGRRLIVHLDIAAAERD